VLEAENGEEALRLVSERNPDIVLMDIAMPVMDGLEALSLIRSGAANSSVPVIAVTASAFEEDRRRVMAAGANDFIRKPIDRFELLEKIGTALKLKYKYAAGEGRDDPSADGGGAAYDLAAVPEGLKRELRKAAVELAPFQADEVIKAIGKIEAPLAARLAKLLARFDFQAIVALLDEKGENNG
jgi:CheY-like chemotaxis protein